MTPEPHRPHRCRPLASPPPPLLTFSTFLSDMVRLHSRPLSPERQRAAVALHFRASQASFASPAAIGCRRSVSPLLLVVSGPSSDSGFRPLNQPSGFVGCTARPRVRPTVKAARRCNESPRRKFRFEKRRAVWKNGFGQDWKGSKFEALTRKGSL